MPNASIVLANRRDEIARLSQFVVRFCEQHRLAADEVLDVNLVLDEVVINIISHGYSDEREHEIHVTLAINRQFLIIEVEDDGRPFNPKDVPPPSHLELPIEERPIGGMGVHIVRSLTDRIEHRRTDGKNVLTLRKKRHVKN